MGTEPLSSQIGNGNGTREDERAIGHLVLWVWNGAKRNWKILLVVLAFMANSHWAKAMLESATGWKLPEPESRHEAVYSSEPMADEWKHTVDKRLAVLEKQNKTIIKLLTE